MKSAAGEAIAKAFPASAFDDLASHLDRLFDCVGPGSGPVGVACSGGGDSIALLHAAASWGRARGRGVRAASVDHGLRPESAAEARFVANVCADLGLKHDVLLWRDARDGPGLQERGRRARYRLLSAWAAREGLGAVFLGHTRDDVGETHLMRMRRGGGAFARAAMAPAFRGACGAGPAVAFLRPFLHVERAELRAALSAAGRAWIDDPSNADPRFERVRVRRATTAGERARAAGAAEDHRLARAAEERAALDLLNEAVVFGLAGDGAITDVEPFRAADRDVALRAVDFLLRRTAGAEHPPRREKLERFLAALTARPPRLAALHGCRTVRGGDRLHAVREKRSAVKRLTDDAHPDPRFWDRRFRIPERGSPPDVCTLAQARALAGETGAPPGVFEAFPSGLRPGEVTFIVDYPHAFGVRRF